MKYTVCFLDDQAHAKLIEADSAKIAAWRFLRQDARADTSQITVESRPAAPPRFRSNTHYRACDLATIPEPSETAETELALRFAYYPDQAFVVSGSADSLRRLANSLLRELDKFSTRSDLSKHTTIFSSRLIPGDGAHGADVIAFEADDDIDRYWKRWHGSRGFFAQYGRRLFLLLAGILACIGIRTIAQWLF